LGDFSLILLGEGKISKISSMGTGKTVPVSVAGAAGWMAQDEIPGDIKGSAGSWSFSGRLEYEKVGEVCAG
jgi:hypothetical protein